VIIVGALDEDGAHRVAWVGLPGRVLAGNASHPKGPICDRSVLGTETFPSATSPVWGVAYQPYRSEEEESKTSESNDTDSPHSHIGSSPFEFSVATP
jgi:hypothetical protein